MFVVATFSDCFIEGDISFVEYMVNLFSNLFLSEYYISRPYLFIFISNHVFTKFKSLIIFIKHTFQSYIVPITFKSFQHQLMGCLHKFYTMLSLLVTSRSIMPPYSRLVHLHSIISDVDSENKYK